MASLIEHLPWRGCQYGQLDGQKIAVVGYSHWLDAGDRDHPDVTRDVIECVMEDREWANIAFFRQIRDYFGYSTHRDFWPCVAFFNFLPDCVGDEAERYRHGTEQQIERGRERFPRLLNELKPAKVFVFTRRYWALRPHNLDDLDEGDLPEYARNFKKATCVGCPVFFLRHPQGARKAPMIETVSLLLRARPCAAIL